jgi:hybrid cluster-associated redox disulfide protein
MSAVAKAAGRSTPRPRRSRGPTAATVIEGFLAAHPAAVTVFMAHHMQCPGCVMAQFDTIAEAALVYGIPVPLLLAELDAALAAERLAAERRAAAHPPTDPTPEPQP